MDQTLRDKLQSTQLSESDVIAILAWQLSLPAEEMDCALIDECDRFLAPDAPGMDETHKTQLYERLLTEIQSGKSSRDLPRAQHARVPHRRMRARRTLTLLLVALLMLALAVGAVAYSIHRGVLSFNEDWGWLAPLTYLEGADEFVTSGTLYHQELEHVTVDIIEAVTDGAELRIVYSVQNNDGVAFEGDIGTDYMSVPGAEEDGVHMCDYVVVNGQDAYFDDAWQAPGDKPGQALYYLQSNLPAWGLDISGEEVLHLGLPMIGHVEVVDGQYTGKGLVQFTIPAKIPPERMLTAELVSSRMGGHTVTIQQAVFSPLNGYVQIHVEGITAQEFGRDFTTMGEVYGPDGYALSGADVYGSDQTESGLLIGFTMYPPTGGWPETLVLALEREDYSPDWEAIIRLSQASESSK